MWGKARGFKNLDTPVAPRTFGGLVDVQKNGRGKKERGNRRRSAAEEGQPKKNVSQKSARRGPPFNFWGADQNMSPGKGRGPSKETNVEVTIEYRGNGEWEKKKGKVPTGHRLTVLVGRGKTKRGGHGGYCFTRTAPAEENGNGSPRTENMSPRGKKGRFPPSPSTYPPRRGAQLHVTHQNATENSCALPHGKPSTLGIKSRFAPNSTTKILRRNPLLGQEPMGGLSIVFLEKDDCPGRGESRSL